MRRLLLTVSALTLAWCNAAHAQTQPEAASDGSTKVEEVVVTAERRGVNLQSSAIADAKIEYSGLGVVDDVQRPGWFVRILDWVYPF